MSEVRIPVAQQPGVELVFDSDDIERFTTPHDVRELPSENGWASRELTGVSHLSITFKPGCKAHFEVVAAS